MNAGELSALLVWAAAATYTISLVAYSLDLARVADDVTRASREKVPVGAAVGAGASSGAAVPPMPGPEAPARPRRAAGIARSTLYLGFALELAAIVLRGIAAGRWPTANMYEFTLVGTTVAVGVLILVQRRRSIPILGVIVTLLAVMALTLATAVFYVDAEGVQPALQSYWIVIHVGVAISATGVFTVAFATSLTQLVKDSRETALAAVGAGRAPSRFGGFVLRPGWRWLDGVPEARNLEALSFRLNAIGFVLWTFTLIAGAIWAEHAWGRYWGWDPKEVGTFVAWVVYAAYLHARTTRGWSGRRAAYFVLVGYGVVLANFTVINLFVTGKHAYKGF